MNSSQTDPLSLDMLNKVQNALPDGVEMHRHYCLAPYTTFHSGGYADAFIDVTNSDHLAVICQHIQSLQPPYIVIGSGSNLLVSDDGFRGLVIRNRTSHCQIGETTIADTGVSLARLFALCRKAGLSGLEFAVGIPGTLGGALVSNAGAYRQNVSSVVKRVEVVAEARQSWEDADWMDFSYRHSILRDHCSSSAVVIRAELQLHQDNPVDIAARAHTYQLQRKGKQPLERSAGSFFKNVYDPNLAATFPGLSDALRESGVIPAGAIIEACGLKGCAIGDAQVSPKHANFIVNNGQATSTQICSLSDHIKKAVFHRFGVYLEEEVLKVGDWSRYQAIPWEDNKD